MAHCNTVLSQLLKMVGRHEFEKIASNHHQGQKLRKTSRWSQFVALAFAQLTGRQSLRDIESNLNAQRQHAYHLGGTAVTRSSLARLNNRQVRKSEPFTVSDIGFLTCYQIPHYGL